MKHNVFARMMFYTPINIKVRIHNIDHFMQLILNEIVGV